MSRLPAALCFAICLSLAVVSEALCAVPEIPAGTKTLAGIVLDIKAPLNRKLEELRRTYGIREIKAGGLRFMGKSDQPVLTVETNRTLNPAGTQRVEEFLYRNSSQQLVLHERVITHGQNLRFHDFQQRVLQAGVENYDLESDGQTLKEASIGMGSGTVFRVLTTRERTGTVHIKRHQVSVGGMQQIEIKDTVYREASYRTYEYDILEPQMTVFALGGSRWGWASWLGTLRIAVRKTPGLLVPEVTYEKVGTGDSDRLEGFERFSVELHERLIVPFIERGPVRLIGQVVGQSWVWPKSRSMQVIGAESKFLNELIVIRNEVNQAKTNPSVLSLVEIKLNVIIRDIQEGKLKISDFR